jgi:hypothetical protein
LAFGVEGVLRDYTHIARNFTILCPGTTAAALEIA